jgi:hypothetical protein
MKKETEYMVNGRVIVDGKQLFGIEDQAGTIIRVFNTTLKVQLDNGTKWFISKYNCTPFEDAM